MGAVYQVISSTTSFPFQSTPVSLGWMQNPFDVSAQLFMTSTSATATAGIQYTLDDLANQPLSSLWRWSDTTLISTTTYAGTSQAGLVTLLGPVTYVRANITTVSAGNMEFKVLQGLGG